MAQILFFLKATGSSLLRASYTSVQDLVAEQPCVGCVAAPQHDPFCPRRSCCELCGSETSPVYGACREHQTAGQLLCRTPFRRVVAKLLEVLCVFWCLSLKFCFYIGVVYDVNFRARL